MRILVDLLVFPDVRAEASCQTSCSCFSIKLSATSGARNLSVGFLLQDTHKFLSDSNYANKVTSCMSRPESLQVVQVVL